MRAALLQMSSTDDPAANAETLAAALRAAAADRATLICTPEMTNVVAPRARLLEVVTDESADPCLAVAREAARALGVTVALGSLALRDGADDGPDRLINRAFVLGPDGEVRARYDKIHLFDVDVSATETWRESATFRPGGRLVTVPVDDMTIGLTICYDLRFPHLHRALAQAGADVLLNPAAFTRPTGEAHWEVLLRARAIETGAYVLAAAQTGRHVSGNTVRETHGHSLAVGPWGEVVARMGREEGHITLDLDPAAVTEARRRLPSLRHDRPFA